MPTKIRLQRYGKKRFAFYHVVVADARAPRDGKFIEKLGTYNPNDNPATIDINFDRCLHWVKQGAQPSDTCRALLSYKGVMHKDHLDRGVLKGALTQEQADKKFEAWMKEKEGKVLGKKDRLAKASADAKKARLAAEQEANAKKAAEVLAKAKPAAEETASEVVAEESADTEVKAEETKAVVETPVAEGTPAEEVKKEAPVAKETPAKEVKKEAPVAEETPAKEVKKEAPVAKETPAEEVKEEAPVAEETPAKEVKEEAPVAEETPAEEVKEEAPVAEETPAKEVKAEATEEVPAEDAANEQAEKDEA